MHYLTLVAVEVEPTEAEPYTDSIMALKVKQIQEELKKANDEGISKIMQKITLSRMRHLSNPFSRSVDSAVCNAMEPYWVNTEDPDYLEFEDHTEDLESEYNDGSAEMVIISNGTAMLPNQYEFSKRFTIKDGKVYEKNAGPCKQNRRTKKAKKMIVNTRKYSHCYKSIKEFAEENFCYRYDETTGQYGYYCNPNAFWDWYQIGGRWPCEFLVRTDCPEYSLGERDFDETVEAPEGYVWVSAARKKDIAWDIMLSYKREKAIEQFRELEAAFRLGTIPKGYYGRITEKGIFGFFDTIYVKDETEEEYLLRRHLTEKAKYPFRPDAFLSENGWNHHETFVHNGDQTHFAEKESWVDELYSFIENLSDETVLVAVDNHS